MNETKTLFRCLKHLNPGWLQKDIAAALHKSESLISWLNQGKRTIEYDTAEFIRKLIADRIADLTGDQYTYRQVQRIARYYEQIVAGAETPDLVDLSNKDNLEYKIAAAIATKGMAIMV